MLEWLESHELPCLFKTVFGMECPGCGCQRAIILMLQGELKEAFLMWPPFIPFFLFLLFVFARMAGIKKISREVLKNVGFVCLIIILISYLLKLNINTY